MSVRELNKTEKLEEKYSWPAVLFKGDPDLHFARKRKVKESKTPAAVPVLVSRGSGLSKNARMRLLLLEKQKGVCAYCDFKLKVLDDAVLDHIKPRSKGGVDTINNRALVCSGCDRLKSSFFTLEEVEGALRKAMVVYSMARARVDLFKRLRKKNILC